MATEYFQNLLAGFEETILNSVEKATQRAYSAVVEDFQTKTLSLGKRKRFKAKSPHKEPSPEKPKIDKETRSKLKEEHYKKVEETKDFTKKLNEEKAERKRRHQEREKEQRDKIMKEIEEEQKLRQDRLKTFEEEKQKRVQELKAKAEQRKKQLQEMKELTNQEYKKATNYKPLYKKLEEKFNNQVLMPELEKKKAQLAQKRMMYQPIDSKEIQEHAKKVDLIKQEQETKRLKELQQKQLDYKLNSVSQENRSKFMEAAIEEEKRKKEEQRKAEEDRKRLLERKRQYADLVKEMFQPTVDQLKRKEIELAKERLKHPSARRQTLSQNPSSKSWNPSPSMMNSNETERAAAQIKKRKWKKNPMVPEPPPRPEPKKVDYLAERRKVRESQQKNMSFAFKKIDLDQEFNSASNTDPEELRKKAAEVEKEARRQEAKILAYKSQDQQALEASSQVNDMLISSIRAKLALLEKTSSPS